MRDSDVVCETRAYRLKAIQETSHKEAARRDAEGNAPSLDKSSDSPSEEASNEEETGRVPDYTPKKTHLDVDSDASIVDSSIKQKVTPMGSITSQPYHTRLVPIGRIGEEALCLGIKNTKPLFKITAFPYRDQD
ncbi:hypothetical protein LWI29_019785 [Acer saccharum]|uniref:Uncharacterized protein n=1 Tax=Acer saccharum TaxID=4024 RepID=A0AA39ST83_ACESA|nr:hypothetical protein LWI29_019785 [Acer saccharum]